MIADKRCRFPNTYCLTDSVAQWLRWRLPVLLLSLLLLVFCSLSQAEESLVQLQHESSLRQAYLIPDHNSDLIQVGVVFTAGEVDSRAPEGLSHYLEHLMFWHADKVNDQPYHARGGNAWVNGIVTNYSNVGQESELDDMFAFVRRLFEVPTLQRQFMLDERKVVTREYDLRVSENPDFRAATRLRKRLYDNHQVSRSVIGTPASIGQQSIEQSVAFHQRYYVPANAILIVTGALTQNQVIPLIDKWLKDIPEGVPHRQSWRQQTVAKPLDVRETYFDPQVKNDRLIALMLAKHSMPEDRLQAEYTGRLLQMILTSALPGSLARPLRLDQFVFRAFDLDIFAVLENQIEVQFYGESDAGVDLDAASARLIAAFQKLASEGIPEETIQRVKARLLQQETRLEKNAANTLWRTYRHLSLGLAPNGRQDHLRRIEAVTKSDLDAMLGAIGKPERRAVGFLPGSR